MFGGLVFGITKGSILEFRNFFVGLVGCSFYRFFGGSREYGLVTGRGEFYF